MTLLLIYLHDRVDLSVALLVITKLSPAFVNDVVPSAKFVLLYCYTLDCYTSRYICFYLALSVEYKITCLPTHFECRDTLLRHLIHYRVVTLTSDVLDIIPE